MLCEDILSRAQYERTFKTQSPEIAAANYQQKPIDQEGRLYKHFKTYGDIPRDKHGNALFRGIFSYTDTADEGSDWLAHYVYGVYQEEAYILDVVFTQSPMEVTEPAVAKSLYDYKVNVATIESNNGGRGFARQVERRLHGDYHSNVTKVQWFHNSQNKIARILSNSTWVMDHIYFPTNWRDRWPDLFDFLTRYQREGKNEHDDAPDALTGVAESIQNKVHIDDRPRLASQVSMLKQYGLGGDY